MSDVNIKVKNSIVIKQNLVILGGSSVEGENLILEEGLNFVERFAPKITQDNETMKALYGVQKDEIQSVNDEIQINIDNTFLQSLNLYGIQKWEKILKLESNADLDINTRKELLLTKRRFRPPFTRQNLQKILESVWGNGNYTFEIYPNEFQLIIDIHTNEPEVYLKFQKYIRSLIPANTYVIFSIQYTYLYLYRNYTYNKLSVFTYGELSKYSKQR